MPELLEATAGLPRVIVGDGPLRPAAPDTVGFVPPAELGAYYERATVVACPSRREGYGVVAREAMAYGRAVVATGVGGLADAVEDGVTGLVVPPNDPAALRAAIAELLADPDRARDLGRAARARAQAELVVGPGHRVARGRVRRGARSYRLTRPYPWSERERRPARDRRGCAPRPRQPARRLATGRDPVRRRAVRRAGGRARARLGRARDRRARRRRRRPRVRELRRPGDRRRQLDGRGQPCALRGASAHPGGRHVPGRDGAGGGGGRDRARPSRTSTSSRGRSSCRGARLRTRRGSSATAATGQSSAAPRSSGTTAPGSPS